MNIVLQPGTYDLGAVDLVMDVSWVNLCALVVNSVEPTVTLVSTFVPLSPPVTTSIEIIADNISVVGIETQEAVLIGNLSQSNTGILFESCKGGDYFGIFLLDGYATLKNCTAGDNLGYCINDNHNTMINCIGGEYLGKADHNNYLKASYCSGGANSFSFGNANYGEYRYCSTTDPNLPPVTSPGLIEYCTDNRFELALNFEALNTFTYVAPENFAIPNVIDNPNSVIVTIKVNGVAYSFDTPINKYDVVTVDVSAIGFIILHCYIV